ncbi:MAG: patatin-like phospholipase family protein [Bacteroidales bacterium]|nr:patatin-like phospholipase family protein [Bacteroidales bacterium]
MKLIRAWYRGKRIVILTFLILLSGANQYITGQQSVNSRPRIGLALSGGGALGMAHVGVLKVMEEAGLRPDYITGVSMGSIVGSLYSIGYSADTMQLLFRTTDWDLILSNNVPENRVIFTEKRYFNNSILALPILSRKVRLPSGLINGQQIEKALSHFTWSAADINDFSKLPVPFLCIGTDLVSTGKVVLKTGYLADAIRASMAVPSVFTPIKIDTAILIDGGFVRNIAVSELREMGADIVIGSYTGFHRYTEEELQSVTGVLKQLGFFNSINDYARQKKLIDILIEPDVKDFSSTVFTNSDSIINRGYIAALPFREKFRQLADSLDRLGPQKPFVSILNKKAFEFDMIEVTGNELIPDDQILGVLDIMPGQKVTSEMLSEKIDLLYGRSWFDKVKYRVVPGNDSLKLVIECQEKPQAMLYGSIHYDNNLMSGILLNMSVKNLLFQRSMLDIDAFIGQYYRFRISSTQFIDRNQSFGLSASFNTYNTMIPVMELQGETGEFTMRTNIGGISLNKRSGLNHFMSLSVNLENASFYPDFITDESVKRITFNSVNTGFQNQLNTLDTKHFPNSGTVFQLSLNVSRLLNGKTIKDNFRNVFTADQPGDFRFKRLFSACGSIRQYASSGRKVTFTIGADVMLTYTADSAISPHNYYFAGGFESPVSRSIPLTGFHPGEIQVSQFAGMRFDTDWEIHRDIHVGLLTSFALAREPSSEEDYTVLGGYGVGLGYMSVIGPSRIGIMHGFSSTERYFSELKGFISIGFNF